MYTKKMCSEDPYLKRHFKAHTGTVTSLSFNPSGKQLASSSDDESIMMWNISSITTSLRYIARKLPVTHVSFSPNGELMASSQGPYVRLWVPSVRGKSTEFKAHTSTCLSVNFSPDGNSLLTAGADKNIKLWTSASRKFISSLTGHTNWVRAATFSKDGSMVLSCGDDKAVKIWDPKSGKIINTLVERRGVPRFIDFHPRDTCIGVAMSHNVVKLYDIKVMKLLQYYSCHEDSVNAIAFHPNGQYLISGSDDCTSKVIDIVEGRAIYTLQGHKKGVTAVTFTRDGKSFATGSLDKQVLVWETNLVDENIVLGAKTNIRRSLDNNCPETTKVSADSLDKSSQVFEPDVQEVYSAQNYQDSGSSTEDEVKSSGNSCLLHLSNSGTGDSSKASEHASMSTRQLMDAIENLSKENEQLKKALAEMERKVTVLGEAATLKDANNY